MDDANRRCDLEHIIRTAEDTLADASNRNGIARSLEMDQEPIDNQARYVAQVMYHAEQLGIALGEVCSWLQRTRPTVPVAQRRRRGAERSARENLPQTQWAPLPLDPDHGTQRE